MRFMSRHSLHAYARVASQAAVAAGSILARHVGRPKMVETKRSAIDLVTEIDRASERLIDRTVRRAYPTFGFFGEEQGERRSKTSYRWIVDPLDGTNNFVHGFPFFGVSIGLEGDGRMLVGVIYDPLRRELFVATKGGGAWLNGRRIHVSPTRALGQSLVSTGFSSKFLKQTPTYDDYTRRKYSDKEEELIDLVKRQTGVPRLNVLHPSLMYRSFKFLHDVDQEGIKVFFPRLTPPSLPELADQLPDQFVAMRFYGCYTLPETEGNVAFAQTLMDGIAKVVPVVLLNTGLLIDRKHPDFSLRFGDNVVTKASFMTLANNLAVQSAIISRAGAYVGSSGGLSYLPPQYGVPAHAIYSEPGAVKPNHKDLAETVLGNLGGYWVGRVGDVSPESVVDRVLSHLG